MCVRGGKGERRACGSVRGFNTVWCGGYVIPPPSLQVLSTTFSLQCRAPSHHRLHLPRPLLPEMAPQGYVGQLVESYVGVMKEGCRGRWAAELQQYPLFTIAFSLCAATSSTHQNLHCLTRPRQQHSTTFPVHAIHHSAPDTMGELRWHLAVEHLGGPLVSHPQPQQNMSPNRRRSDHSHSSRSLSLEVTHQLWGAGVLTNLY